MKPPFQLTSRVVTLVSEISLLLGRHEGLHAPIPQPKLRRQNRIKTVQGSLEIEGNTLSLEQVTALFESKRVIGPQKDILEVENAIRLYDSLHSFDPMDSKDFLRAHSVLMKGLTKDAGRFRTGAVGILKGSQVSHVAPPAKQVPRLIGELFEFLEAERDLSPLIKACVFHYEVELIHPFSDGNGRMGRFWQSLILSKFHPAFEFIPVESVIKERQSDYYQALEKSDKSGESTVFLELALETIRDALREFLDQLRPEPQTPESRLALAQREFSGRQFSRSEYLRFFKTLSTATASRDLASGVASGLLEKTGTKATARYRYRRGGK